MTTAADQLVARVKKLLEARANTPEGKLRRHIEARADEIKAELVSYIEQDANLINDGASVSIALLDLALERHISLLGHQDAHEMVEFAFRRAVDRLKKRLN